MFRRGILFMLAVSAGAAACQAFGADGAAAPPALKKIVFISGPCPHSPGSHEAEAGARVMKYCLEHARGLPRIETAAFNGWPADDHVLRGAAAVVFTGDLFPPERFPERDRAMAALRELMAKGQGGDHAAFVWKEGSAWYCIRGGGRNGQWSSAFNEKNPAPNDTVYLFGSEDLIQWQYLHDLYDPVEKWWNSDAAVPKFFRLGDRYFLLYSTHNVKTPPRSYQGKGWSRYTLGYYSGRYENQKFHPDHWQKIGGSPDGDGSWVHGQNIYVDDQNRTIMITKLTAGGGTGAFPKTGWAETMSLPLVLTEKDAFLQRMNFIPFSLAASASGLSPLGKASGFGVQLPAPFGQPPTNQPASSQNASTPMEGILRIISSWLSSVTALPALKLNHVQWDIGTTAVSPSTLGT